MNETLQKIIDEIENDKQLTRSGTNERAMIYNSALDKAIKIIKENLIKE